jgi:hypothetical protein
VAQLFSPLWFARTRHRSRSSGQANTRRKRSHLSLESLECRCLPSTVTNLADAGPGSLRDAAVTTPPGGTVDFRPGLSGSITLTSGTLAISQDVTVAGPGARMITVSGNNGFQVFNISPGVTVTISGLTIADGTSPNGDGNGIYNRGMLTVANCTLSGNSSGSLPTFHICRGGGIYNEGTMAVTGSTVTGNTVGSQSYSSTVSGSGGGIYNAGTLTLTDSTLSNNNAQAFDNGSGPVAVAALGGGIYNAGTLTVTASTFSNNSAKGPATRVGSNSGGAIYNAGTLTVTASTFSGNSLGFNAAYGGAIYNSGTLTVTNCTLSGNGGGSFAYGGGIYSAGMLTLNNSVISENNAAFGNGGAGGGIFNDGQGRAAITASTLRGNSATGKFGGTGGAICNLGTLTVADSTLSGNTTKGDYPAGSGGGIYSSGTLTVIASTLSGNSAGYGGGIENGGVLTIIASTLSGNSLIGPSLPPPPYDVYGGGIDNWGTATVIASIVSGNTAQTPGTATGGGIYSRGTLTIIASTITGNSVQAQGSAESRLFPGDAYGGGIANAGTATIVQSTLTGNIALGKGGTDPFSGPYPGGAYGGGIYNGIYSYNGGRQFGALTVLDSTLSGNSAAFVSRGEAVGGGIDNDTRMPGTLRSRNTIVAGNNAPASADVSSLLRSLGHNLIGIGDGGSGYADTDLVGTLTSPLDPKLGPLQDNGGPTPTMALLAGSPAIDAGAPTDSEWDQRGPAYPRLVNGATDIGAYEVQQSHNSGRSVKAAGFAEATPLLQDTGSSAASALDLASPADRPSKPPRQVVVATDQFFASFVKKSAELALSRSSHDLHGWMGDVFTADRP